MMVVAVFGDGGVVRGLLLFLHLVHERIGWVLGLLLAILLHGVGGVDQLQGFFMRVWQGVIDDVQLGQLWGAGDVGTVLDLVVVVPFLWRCWCCLCP